ncbi:MAG: acyl-CoA dehydrogenase family protein [Pseudomonadota bacterium]
MDFNDSLDEATYRARARDWLEINVPPATDGSERSQMAASRAWQAVKAAAGYSCITWPEAWGGQGGSQMEAVIFHQEESRFQVPFDPFEFSLGICMPTLLNYTDDAGRERFAGPAIRGDEIWCQLLSEPAAGSDLAAVRTRALPADDSSGDWILNGHKVWTTFAHIADFGLALCRTDPGVAKHRGLTMFWVDMRAPGVTIEPIHQMSGGSDFNEVFLSDVRIPDSQRLGAVGGGWNASLYMMMHERVALGGSRGPDWPQVIEAARHTPGLRGTALGDQALRERIAEWYVQSEGLKHLRSRALTALSKGETPGPENSIGKLIAGLQIQDMMAGASEVLEEYGILDDPALSPLASAFNRSLLYVPGIRIAGGTDEILKNIIAERVLGMPSDIRVDKDVVFSEIPRKR